MGLGKGLSPAGIELVTPGPYAVLLTFGLMAALVFGTTVMAAGH